MFKSVSNSLSKTKPDYIKCKLFDIPEQFLNGRQTVIWETFYSTLDKN